MGNESYSLQLNNACPNSASANNTPAAMQPPPLWGSATIGNESYALHFLIFAHPPLWATNRLQKCLPYFCICQQHTCCYAASATMGLRHYEHRIRFTSIMLVLILHLPDQQHTCYYATSATMGLRHYGPQPQWATNCIHCIF